MIRIGVAAASMPAKGRVEALVDGIFSVAMTLLVLDIRLPEGVRFVTNSDLLSHFAAVAEALATYVISFVVLAMFWVAHNYQFRYVERIDRPLLWINFTFLLATTIVPFTTNLVSTHSGLSAAVSIYAANILLLAVTLVLHERRMRARRELATNDFAPAIGASMDARLRLMCAVPVVAIVVAQFSPHWGLRAFYLLAFLHFVHVGTNARDFASTPPE